jgi:hypothetical protein
VLERHTFAHRVDELLALLDEHMRGATHPRGLRPACEEERDGAAEPGRNTMPVLV